MKTRFHPLDYWFHRYFALDGMDDVFILWMNKVPAFHPSQRPKGSHPQPKFVCEVFVGLCALATPSFSLSFFLSFFQLNLWELGTLWCCCPPILGLGIGSAIK
jgi:hypothetical protein